MQWLLALLYPSLPQGFHDSTLIHSFILQTYSYWGSVLCHCLSLELNVSKINTLPILGLKIQQKFNTLPNHKHKCIITKSDKYYKAKTKRVTMRMAPVMVEEKGVVNESFPEKVTVWVELWRKGDKVRRGRAFQAENTAYAKVLCQEGAQSAKELKGREYGSNTKNMRERCG